MKRLALLTAITTLVWVYAVSDTVLVTDAYRGVVSVSLHRQPHGIQLASVSIGRYQQGR